MNEGISENMSMTARTFLTSIVLFCSLALFACEWTWWPSISEDTTGLGKSEIARIVKSACCSDAEVVIARNITGVLNNAMVGRLPRAAAESVGFTCENPPGQSCRYTGESKYQIHPMPKNNPDAGKVHIVSYTVVLPNYDDPNDVRVEQKTTVVP